MALAVGLAACTPPTSAPSYDAGWQLPFDRTEVELASVLPGDVRITPAGYAVTLDPVAGSANLSAECSAPCAAVGPSITSAFEGVIDVTIPAPDVFVGGEPQTSATIGVTVQHSLPFDPLAAPGAATRGTMQVQVYAGLAMMGEVVLSGTTTTFAPNTPRTVQVPIGGGGLRNGPFRAVVRLSVPGGVTFVGPAPNATLTLSMPASELALSRAIVRVANEPVQVDPTIVDLDGIDASLRDRATTGELIVQITNPFAVQLNGTLSVGPAGAASVASGPIVAGPGTSTVRIPISAPATRTIMTASEVSVRVTGTATGQESGQSLTVAASAPTILLRPELQLNVRIGD
jgi:hypothetical protein